MNESINKSIERGMALSLSGSTPVTEMSKYVLENALGRKVTMDGYATPAQVLRHLEEVKDEAAAKAAAEAAEHAKHHYEFSNALDSVGLATVFHPEELKFNNPEISIHRGPNDDTLTHRYHEGTHQVALARRTGAGNRIGYGSHQNPRDALMMAIKDFNGKRAKGVNEDYEFDKSGKYITEASKSPNTVRMTSSVRQHLGGGMIAQTRNGKYYLLDPHATNGKLPRPGEEIDPSKHHYIGDGEWTPKHAETVEKINAALGKVPAIKAVDEADHSDFVKALKDSGMDSHFRDSNIQSLTNPGTHDFYGKSGELLSHERDPLTGNHMVMLSKKTPGGMKRAFGSGADAASALKDVMRKYGDDMTEAESLDELSKDTLASYIRKAAIDARHREFRAGRNAVLGIARNNDYRESDKDLVKSLGRQRGITKAADKLAAGPKNESESLDELSKEALLRYIHKSLPDAVGRSHMAGRDAVQGSRSSTLASYAGMDKARNRMAGVETAAKKLARKSVNEAAPPDMEGWVKANKARFIKEYGDKKGHEVLYATAWKLHDKKVDEADDSLKLYLRHEPSKSDPSDSGHRDIAIYGDKDATIFKGRYPWEHRSKPNSRSKQIVLNKAFRPVEWLPASDKIGPRATDESEQDNIDHVKRMKAYHAAVKATDDASMAKVHFRMRHDISQPDHREAYNQLKRKHREARRAEAAAAEHVKGVLFAKHALGESELNELSPATIRSYLTKAIADHSNMKADRGFLSGRSYADHEAGKPTDYDREKAKTMLNRRADKRMKSIQRAIDNLGDDTQRNIKLPAGFGEGVDPGEVSPLFSNK